MDSKSTPTEPSDRGLVFACRIDQKGRATEIDGEATHTPHAHPGFVWLHFVAGPECEQWLRDDDLAPSVIESLLVAGARPRCSVMDDGLLAVLRGVNLNPGHDPEDMVSVRGWFTASRVVTLHIRKVMAIQDVRDRLASGAGPRDAGSLFVHIAAALLGRMLPVIEELEDGLEQVEEQISADEMEKPQSQLGNLKTALIRLRRHMGPQRQALERLRERHPPWLGKAHLTILRELCQSFARVVEDLDLMSARASIARDEISQELAARMNKTMYRLSVIAGIFLPLSFLTGLLGINVGGMPGIENTAAFWWVCVICAVLGGVLVWISRRMSLL